MRVIVTAATSAGVAVIMVMVMVMVVIVRVGMRMSMPVRMSVGMTGSGSRLRLGGTGIAVVMLGIVRVCVGVGMLVSFLQVHVKLSARNFSALLTRDMKMVAFHPQLLELRFQLYRIHAEVQQGADKHVPAEPAENIQIKRFHESCPAAKALI